MHAQLGRNTLKAGWALHFLGETREKILNNSIIYLIGLHVPASAFSLPLEGVQIVVGKLGGWAPALASVFVHTRNYAETVSWTYTLKKIEFQRH